MVKIAKKDFHKDLGSYIEKRRSREREAGKGIRVRIPLRKRRYDEEIPDISPTEVHVEYKKPGFLKRLFTFRKGLIDEAERTEDLTPEEMAKLKSMEDDIEETEKEIIEAEEEIGELKDEEAELIERREGLLTKFFGKLNVFKRKPMDTVMINAENYEEPALDEDVVEVLKITHKWIEQLTPAKKRSFKASKDFQKYKDILDKYGLIKKK